MTITAHCTVCDKDFEIDEKWRGFVSKYPEKVKCPACMKKAGSSQAKSTKAVSETSNKIATAKATTQQKEGKQPITAEMFRRAYDELMAEFADVNKEDIAQYLGGWVSTMVINRSK